MKKWIIVAIVAMFFGIVGYFVGAIRTSGIYENQIEKIRETCLDATFAAERDCADFYSSFEDDNSAESISAYGVVVGTSTTISYMNEVLIACGMDEILLSDATTIKKRIINAANK